MKNKAPLALMEQLIMLLVFALAAALCLQVFVYSAQVSRRCETQANAAAAVQNAAEIAKAYRGDTAQISKRLGGCESADGWLLRYDANWQPIEAENAAYTVLILPQPTEHPALGSARIIAADGTETVFELAVYWQEEIHES